jgi:O-glycosyl hydrolase
VVPNVDHVACENADGQKVLVITNADAARTVVLQMGTMAADLNLPNNSLTTLVWK